jgi:hypothetical protein
MKNALAYLANCSRGFLGTKALAYSAGASKYFRMFSKIMIFVEARLDQSSQHFNLQNGLLSLYLRWFFSLV